MRLQPTGKFDNSAQLYENISVTPLAASMGAEISDVDIANITSAQFADIEHALYRHKMIYFRDQDLSHRDQESFTLRFGKFGTDAYTKGMPDHPNVQPVIKEAQTKVKMIFGEGWHTDSPFLKRPPAISMLRSVEVPSFGGDTIWANTELAYEYLSETMKQILAPLKVHMSAIQVLGNMDRLSAEKSNSLIKSSSSQVTSQSKMGDMEIQVQRQSLIEGSYHPVVRTHPVTGKISLYVECTYSQGFQGMTDEESAPLLEFLQEHITQSSFTCRLRWQKNTLVVWDNRSTLHHAYNDHDGYRREMYRTTVLGEVPV